MKQRILPTSNNDVPILTDRSNLSSPHKITRKQTRKKAVVAITLLFILFLFGILIKKNKDLVETYESQLNVIIQKSEEQMKKVVNEFENKVDTKNNDIELLFKKSTNLAETYESQLSAIIQKSEEQMKKVVNERENKVDVKSSNVEMSDELENTSMQAKSPEFCKDVTEKEGTLVRKIDGLQEIKPFSIEVYHQNDIVSDHIKMYGFWDKPKLDLFKNIILGYSREKNTPLDELTFVDIGSNIGWFTLSMASLGVQVKAFEPMTSNNDMIKRSLCMKSNLMAGVSQRVELFTHGLGPSEQSCFIVSGNINEGDGHTLCGDTENDIHVEPNYSIRGKIVTKRLDDIASTDGQKIVLVKMDVEGFESHVVEGGRNFLLDSKIPYIISEFVPEWMIKYGGDPERMMKRFYDGGYKVKKNDSHLSREQAMNMGQYGLDNDVIFQYIGDHEKL